MERACPGTLSASQRLDWLRLARSENVGPVTFRRLLERYGSPARALAALPDLARRGGRSRGIQVCPKARAEDELAAVESQGARLLTLVEPDYPPALAHVEDAPPVLCVAGNVHLLGRPTVAVVGARNASINGRRLARTLAGGLADAGYVVASGMARGIDAAAHQGGLGGDLGGGTAGVLGGGIDVVYPRENADLFAAVREQGVLLSELPPGTEPMAHHFPRRNRIIAGISLGVVVVEARPQSGSLITARIALEQGREVFAVPGSPLDPRSRGGNDLIRQGAVLTESALDVRAVLDAARETPLAAPRPAFRPASTTAAEAPEDLEPARQSVVASLDYHPVAVDELLRSRQFSPAVVAAVLLELELAGRLERHSGNRVSLIDVS